MIATWSDKLRYRPPFPSFTRPNRADLRVLLRDLQKVSRSYQVVGGRREGKRSSHSQHFVVPRLPHEPNGLQPPKNFLRRFSVPPTDLRIGRRLVRGVLPFLAPKVHSRIAATVPRLLVLLSPLKTLLPCPGLNEGGVHRKVLIGEGPFCLRLGEHLFEEPLGYVPMRKTLSVLGHWTSMSRAGSGKAFKSILKTGPKTSVRYL